MSSLSMLSFIPGHSVAIASLKWNHTQRIWISVLSSFISQNIYNHILFTTSQYQSTFQISSSNPPHRWNEYSSLQGLKPLVLFFHAASLITLFRETLLYLISASLSTSWSQSPPNLSVLPTSFVDKGYIQTQHKTVKSKPI